MKRAGLLQQFNSQIGPFVQLKGDLIRDILIKY
jgi:hypothetical protein